VSTAGLESRAWKVLELEKKFQDWKVLENQ
jgi:hypothetical protein